MLQPCDFRQIISCISKQSAVQAETPNNRTGMPHEAKTSLPSPVRGRVHPLTSGVNCSSESQARAEFFLKTLYEKWRCSSVVSLSFTLCEHSSWMGFLRSWLPALTGGCRAAGWGRQQEARGVDMSQTLEHCSRKQGCRIAVFHSKVW